MFNAKIRFWQLPLAHLHSQRRSAPRRRFCGKTPARERRNLAFEIARAPFLSGFFHLLRCRKDLGQFPEVLGGCREEEFVICAAWAA